LINRPKKSLGQHFLTDAKTIEKIISIAGFSSSDQVLEIGPGRGALTIPLAEKVKAVVAVEKDEDLVRRLEERLVREGINNVNLIADDILRWNFKEMPSVSGRFHVIGNLPYNISKPVLEKLVNNRERLGRAVLMLQKEVANRVAAAPGGKEYGAMSVLIRYHARAASMLQVGKEVFSPRPAVDSTVVELDFERPWPLRSSRDELFTRVVKGSFSHRRKTILNSLRGYFPAMDREVLTSVLERSGIDPSARGETLSINEFLTLTAIMDLTIS